jgi:molybdate transport system substrate-binding protein
MTYSSALKASILLLMLTLSLGATATETPIIAVAASLKFALEEVRTAFKQEQGKTIRISYASSGNLTRQILQNGPFELFLSANSDYAERLHQQQKTLDKGATFALGRLVLLTSKQSNFPVYNDLKGIQKQLQNGQLKRFSIANPEHAPYGIAAREVLQKQRLWKPLKPHLVLGENAAQATQFISSGAAQVGLTSYALALAPALKNRTTFLLIPAEQHQPLRQTAVLLKNAGDTAKLFFNYLQQERARRIFARYGYSAPLKD